MGYYSYEGSQKRNVASPAEKIVEELEITGYSISPKILNEEQVSLFRKLVDETWLQQVKEFGEDKLRALREWGTARALLFYHSQFADLIQHSLVMDVVAKTVGESAILHLMNASLCFPQEQFHQSQWHRDFEKNFTSDTSLSVNAFWVLDPFTEETGATWYVPHSHCFGFEPSDEFIRAHAVCVHAEPGSVIFFDSKIFHRAGNNRSSSTRRAVNFQYTRPFIKQQIDFPALFDKKIDRETLLGKLLGMWTVPPRSLVEFRADPAKRTYKPGQG